MRDRNFTGVAALLAVIAILTAVAAGLGVFARGDGTYETVTSVRGVTYQMATTGVYAYNAQRLVAEGIGWDVATLVLAAPALLVTLPFVARGSFRGRLVAIGLLGYLLYQYLEYAVTWAFGPLFPLFIVIYAASLAGIVWLGVGIARQRVAHRFGDGFPRRPYALLTGGMAVLLALMWAQRIATGLAGDLEAASLWGETTMVVPALDLGLVVPTALFIAVLVWRRSPVGYVLAAIWVVFSIAMASAIASMLVAAGVVEGTFEIPPMLMFGGYLLASLALAWPIFGRAASTSVGETATADSVPAERRHVTGVGRPA